MIIFGQVIFLKVRRIIQFLLCLFIFTLILTIYSSWSSISNNYADNYNNVFSKKTSDDSLKQSLGYGRPNLPKYIHLDLKGAPPKAQQFYDSFFNFLQSLQMGVKGVLIEYEDTLPLQGNLANISHHSAYTKFDIELIQQAGRQHKLEIIPLIQTFGHLEWILKLEQYKSYRDDLDLPMVISPCLNETYVLLEDLLKQTLDMHPDSSIIHIGCDEVILKHTNPTCTTTSVSLSEIYVKHIRQVVDIVRKIRPGIRILIWDDILRLEGFVNNNILLNQLKAQVEPVSWNYFPLFDKNYRLSSAWNIYPKFFSGNWIASAFKGGLHRFSMTTNTSHHVFNNREWLRFIESSNFQKDQFSAIILTGWSRFDHFMPLCDLLPTAYPSLLYSLYMLNTGQYAVDESIVSCQNLVESIGKSSRLCDLLPGLNIWSDTLSLSILFRKIQSRLKTLNTIAPTFNRKHLFVRRHELHSRLSELNFFRRNLMKSKTVLNRHLTELYTDDVIHEWFELYVNPIENEINTTFVEFSLTDNITTWQRRPLIKNSF